MEPLLLLEEEIGVVFNFRKFCDLRLGYRVLEEAVSSYI